MAWWTKHWEDIRPQLKYDAIKAGIGIPGIPAAYWLIQRVRHMPVDWYVAAVLVALFLAFIFVSTRQRKAATQPSTAIQAVEGPVAVSVKAVDEYYKVGSGPFLDELEAHFQRLAVYHKDQKERERFLIRALAAGAASYLHDVSWFTIFRSQLNALNELNSKGAMIRDELRQFYNAAALLNPHLFNDYTFDSWVEYLESQTLIRQDGNIVQITVRGKDFLKYLVLRGFSASQRIN